MDDEQQIEEMIAEGQRVVNEAIAEFRPKAIVAAYSSGNDSIVSTHFAMTNLPGCFVFNADTMIGLGPSRCHLRAVCEKFNWPLQIGQATPEGPQKKYKVGGKLVPFDERSLPAGRWTEGNSSYEEFVLNFGFPGRGLHARMYQRLKERPICRMLRELGARQAKAGPKVLIISGIRGDESAIRAGYKRATAAGNFGEIWVNPFYWRTAADFEAYRQEFGLPRNPVKAKCGISGECCCGTFGDGAERSSYRIVDPAFADYLDELERRVAANGFPWGWGQDPPDSWKAKERMIKDAKRGQGFLFDADERIAIFQPMCVGCNNGRR